MLKIKDNVDLKILIDKFGFKPLYSCETGKIIELYRIEGHYRGDKEKNRQTATITLSENRIANAKDQKVNWFKILPEKRTIKPEYNYLKLDVEDFDILYDLIKADLVEKVDD